MKTFRELRESILLNEIEALTHKKKIAAAQSEFNKAAAAHAKAADVHNDLGKKHSTAYIKAMKAKGHSRDGLIANPPEGAHKNADFRKKEAHSRYFELHHAASKGNIGASHRLAMGADRHAQHIDDKHDKHAVKLHNNMVDAHHKLQAAKKASPLHKAKAAVHKLAKKVGVREDATDDAVKAFLKKGGKIKKLAPGKAAGYHGKDDPGKDMKGMMDKGDTKAIGTRKKVKSMAAEEIGVKVLHKGKEVKTKDKIGVKVLHKGKEVKEISKATKGSYVRKAADDMAKAADKMARSNTDTSASSIVKNAKRFVKRRTGIARATK